MNRIQSTVLSCPGSININKNHERQEVVKCSYYTNDLPVETDELLLHQYMECLPGLSPEAKTKRPKAPRGFQLAINDHKRMITTIWPRITDGAAKEFPLFANHYQKILGTATPNFLGAKIPVQSELNCPEWEARLANYHDDKLCDLLKNGWPLGFNMDKPPQSVTENHSSAMNHLPHVRKFIDVELGCNAILGPFTDVPFSPWFRVSPIMTHPKRDSTERRIILDLSFPVGHGVNEGISTNDHLGSDITYSLPNINDLTHIIKTNGKGALLSKADLTRAYRELRADPLDAPLLGMKVDGQIYIDRCPPFGCRSSAAFCQRVANALLYMMAQLGHKIIAYLDDFAACCPTKKMAFDSYEAFIDLTAKLGLRLAKHKSLPPATKMEWLGYEVDSQLMKISIPQEKLDQLLSDCTAWLSKSRANKAMVQSIAGRLIYVGNCILPARKFTVRILSTLRAMPESGWTTLSKGFKSDIAWFLEYAKMANGVYLFSPDRPVIEIICDSSLYGGGGMSENLCYTWPYSKSHMTRFKDIHHLEAINILVAYETLAPRFDLTPARVILWTDNIASSFALSTGKNEGRNAGGMC